MREGRRRDKDTCGEDKKRRKEWENPKTRKPPNSNHHISILFCKTEFHFIFHHMVFV